MAVYSEKCCGAVTYTMKDGNPFYLLVKNRSGHCGFPKGHVEPGETEQETALREIAEETGVEAVLSDGGFRREYLYTIGDGIIKLGVYFIAYYVNNTPKAENEIDKLWLVPYEEALSILNFENDREILRAAHTVIISDGKGSSL